MTYVCTPPLSQIYILTAQLSLTLHSCPLYSIVVVLWAVLKTAYCAPIIIANIASVRFYLCVSVYVTSAVHPVQITTDNYKTRKSEWSSFRHVSCGRDWSEFVILLA